MVESWTQYSPLIGWQVVCVEGDSAFGFSGLEVETIARYKLPIVLIIVNNNGIYSGFESPLYEEITEEGEPTLTSPPTALLPAVRYILCVTNLILPSHTRIYFKTENQSVNQSKTI